jgi:hypothetical protein
MAHEWKKTEKNFYLPGNKPEIIRIPSFRFFSIEGRGNPNDAFFAEYIGVLYSLSYGIKMSPKKGSAPADYYEYTVYPLEGVWDITEEAKKLPMDKLDKDSLVFHLMIRQPDFVTTEFAQFIISQTKKKKPHPLLEKVIFSAYEEGACIQMMHVGKFDDEPVSFRIMEDFCKENKLIRESKIHREIYLSDPRRVSPDKLKTVLRFKTIKP